MIKKAHWGESNGLGSSSRDVNAVSNECNKNECNNECELKCSCLGGWGLFDWIGLISEFKRPALCAPRH